MFVYFSSIVYQIPTVASASTDLFRLSESTCMASPAHKKQRYFSSKRDDTCVKHTKPVGWVNW